jgi:hypothetical protein
VGSKSVLPGKGGLKLKAIVVTTDNKMEVKEFCSPLYKSCREVIDGYIEIVRPKGLPRPYCMVVDDERMLKDLPLNFVGSTFYETAKHGVPIVGNIIILKDGFTSDGPDLVGLESEDIEIISNAVNKILGIRSKGVKFDLKGIVK